MLQWIIMVKGVSMHVEKGMLFREKNKSSGKLGRGGLKVGRGNIPEKCSAVFAPKHFGWESSGLFLFIKNYIRKTNFTYAHLNYHL